MSAHRPAAHRVATVALVAAALVTPALVRGQSPTPTVPATPSGAPVAAPSAGPTTAPSLAPAPVGSIVPGRSGMPGASPSASVPVDLGPPGSGGAPQGWVTGVCTAWARLDEVQSIVAQLGQAALAGDSQAMAYAAIEAGLLANQALTALDGLGDRWNPGVSLAGFLNATAFSLVDLGVALAEADPSDPDALRNAMGSAIGAYDGWARVGEEVQLLHDTTGFDCTGVPVPSAAPMPDASAAAPTPGRSPGGDPELESRFPKQVEGIDITPTSRAGADLLASSDPEDLQSAQRLKDLTDFLAASGHSIDDVSVAFAYIPTDDGLGASITALRVKGGSAADLLEGLIPLITVDYPEPVRDTVTVAGRQLVRISNGPYDPAGVYEVLVPSGDTLFAVSAADQMLTDIVAALPA